MAWITAIVVLVLNVVLTGAGVVYASTVPLPDDPHVPQASVLYYRDGTTVLARVGVANRTDVPLDQVPRPVRHAVLASEDRGFYGHFGLSLRGVVRAFWADLFGQRQGASTITQQYARNAYLTQERSVDRKAREAVLAVKLERRYTKNEILQRYLNGIYYGRGAYGIAAAAKAYFGTTPDRLTLAQGAVLAAVIKDPWGFDPEVNAQAARDRWQWVINRMVDASWLSRADVKVVTYPEIISTAAAAASLGGPNGLVVDAVEKELAVRGIPAQQLHTAGLRVVTTIEQKAQTAAVERMAGVDGHDPELRGALVAVDPATGGVRAYYGGKEGKGFFDHAAAAHTPASTFKPIALAAGLQANVSYMSRWDGSSPRLFAGRLGVGLRNQKDIQCPDCTLDESMLQSLNTPFYALAEQLGAGKIRQLAIDLGIPDTYQGVPSMVDLKGDPKPGKTRSDISIGRYAVAPADLSSVYASLASGGVRTERHVVESVTGADGVRQYTAPSSGRRVISREVAADVTTVLHHVAQRDGEPTGHPAALKTGTQQWGNTSDNQDAWVAGYTPALATVVWIGKANPGPIRDAAGSPIAGDGLPVQLWREFMTEALKDSQPAPLPKPAHLGRVDVGDAGRAGRNADGIGGLAPVDYTQADGRMLSLTFDDGPSQHTGAVLDLLAKNQVKATFCVVGEQAKAYPALVRRIVSEGHQLCAHSMRHGNLGTMTSAKIKADITENLTAIRAAAPNAKVTYFRAPGGSWGRAITVGVDLGLTPLGWNVDPEDWNTPGVDAIVRAVREQIRPRSVVLMHDGGGDRRQTIEALRQLIPQLREANWSFDVPGVNVTGPVGGAGAGAGAGGSAGSGRRIGGGRSSQPTDAFRPSRAAVAPSKSARGG